jgi:hypothetical protein
MATVVTNQPSDTGSTNAGYFLALAVIVLLVLAFIFYGLPNLGLEQLTLVHQLVFQVK